MPEDRTLPENPLAFIQRHVKERKIYWTYHVNMRLAQRFIPRSAVLDSVESFEILESYPEDKYLPSYLVYASHEDVVFHVLFALDEKGDNVRVVTAYRPTISEWGRDLKTRRRLR
jgi:hypothetical protein